MNSRSLRFFVAAVSIAAAGQLFGSSALAADEKKATPTPTPRPTGGTSLNEIAKDTQLKGKEEGKGIVISNENLAGYAEKGEVTQGSGGTTLGRRPVRPPGSAVQATDPTSPSSQTDERMRYWRSQYQSQVNLIATIKNQIALLDAEIPGLWTDFYSRDDPAYRDGVIKPRLDAALDRRKRLEGQLAEAEPKLNEIKDQARRDGAEPGWFRGVVVPTPIPPSPTPGLLNY